MDLDPLVHSIKNKTRFKEKDMNDHFCDLVSQSATIFEKDYHPQIDKYYMDWKDQKPDKSTPWIGAANWSTMVSSTSADGLTPRILDDTLGFNEPIEMHGLDDSDEGKDRESRMNKFMKWDVESHDDLKTSLWFFVENAVWAGNGFAYTFMEREKGWIEDEYDTYVINGAVATSFEQAVGPDGQTPILMPVFDGDRPLQMEDGLTEIIMQMGIPFEVGHTIEKEFKWKKFGPKTITIDNKNVFWSPDAESLEDAFHTGFVAIRIFKTLNQINKMLSQGGEDLYKNLTKIEAANFASGKWQESETGKHDDLLRSKLWKTRKMEFHLIFAHYDIDNDALEEPVVILTHLESKTLLGWEKFPYEHGQCPLVSGSIKPSSTKVLGTGIIEMLYPAKGYLDALRNQMTDMRTQYIKPKRLYTEGSGFDPAIHQAGPYSPDWELLNISESAIRLERTDTFSLDARKEEEQIRTDIEQRSSVTKNVMGSEDTRNQTFGGIQKLLEESGKSRMMYKLWMVQVLQKIFYQRYRIYKQFWGKNSNDDPQIQAWIREIMDQRNSPLDEETMDAMDHNFNLVMRASTEDRRLQMVLAQEKHQFLIQEPLIAEMPKYRRKLLVDVLRSIGDPNPEESVPTVEDYENYQVQIQKQALKELQEEQAKEAKEAQDEEIRKEEYHKEMGRQGQ